MINKYIHDSPGTVSNTFGLYLREALLKILTPYEQLQQKEPQQQH